MTGVGLAGGELFVTVMAEEGAIGDGGDAEEEQGGVGEGGRSGIVVMSALESGGAGAGGTAWWPRTEAVG